MDRIEDTALREKYQSLSCQVCATTIGVCGHHLMSRGSWGPDVDDNLMALCVAHHNEVHHGLKDFVKKYHLRRVMESKGWELIENRKWINYKLWEMKQ